MLTYVDRIKVKVKPDDGARESLSGTDVRTLKLVAKFNSRSV